MEARGDGKHVLVELGEHVNCCCHGNVSAFSYLVREMICREEVADDRFEDVGQDPSEAFGMLMIWKWRRNLGVKRARPPPGGAAAQMILNFSIDFLKKLGLS